MKNIIFFIFYFYANSILAQMHISKNSVIVNKKDSIILLDAVNAEPLNPFITESYKFTNIKTESKNDKINTEKIISYEALTVKRLENSTIITIKQLDRIIQDTSLKIFMNEAIPMQPK